MTSYIAHATEWPGKPGSRRGLLLVLLGFVFSLTAFGAADALIHLTSSATGFVLAGMAAMLVLRALPARLPVTALTRDRTFGKAVRAIQPGSYAARLVLENARLECKLRVSTDELRRSRARIAAAAAEERRRLERELHDSAQNRLVGLQIRLRLAFERAEESAPEVARMLATLDEQAEGVGEELRRIAHGISPPMLAARGLADALAGEACLSGIPVRTFAGQIGFSAPEVELAVYLCCLEAIQNAAKHAGDGASVKVRLSREGDELAFRVDDDGCGFDSKALEGSGLTGIRDRIGAVGGRVQVTSTPGRGATVAGAVPWPARGT